MDSGTGNTGSTFYETGYVSQAELGTGLPLPGAPRDKPLYSDHIYQMPPNYAANDAVLIDSNLPVQLIVPNIPTNFGALSFLAACGQWPGYSGLHCTSRRRHV